jgi:hypothetical protein
MLDAIQGRDTSVRNTISKGRFVQGAQHPRTFAGGHIGQGHINPGSVQYFRVVFLCVSDCNCTYLPSKDVQLYNVQCTLHISSTFLLLFYMKNEGIKVAGTVFSARM